MRKDGVSFPKSSFLGMEKDVSLIMEKILKNKNLLKLLYYSVKDWEKQPDLSSEQIKQLIEEKTISIVPKIVANEIPTQKNFIRISFGNFMPNASNPFYRDCLMEIKIVCHFDNWDLGNFKLRPYRIAGELDAMLNDQHLVGIGKLEFLAADQNVYDDEFGGVTLEYLIIHGNEDEVNPLV